MSTIVPLYCFKLDEFTGEITRIVIENFHTVHPSKYIPDRVNYTFRIGKTTYDVHGSNIDKFINWKVYSFTDDIDKAKNIMFEDIKMRYFKAERDAERYATVLVNLKEGVKNGENQQQTKRR